jgi:hypothetical protein bfra3_11751
MKKYDVVIGIDPDVDESGVAFLIVESRIIEVSNLTFADLLDYLRETRDFLIKEGRLFAVVVEAGWLNKAHWHVGGGGSAARSAAIGNHTGRNHEVGRKIVEMCRHYGIEVVEQPPLRKMWKGRDGKITHEELQHLAIITGKTNQETRDAALIAWEYAGLPIRIKNQYNK